jgi:dTDP-4-dehydrorhamnose 3,5-epimerase
MDSEAWCRSGVAPASDLCLDDFQQDAPYAPPAPKALELPPGMIHGVTVTSLNTNPDTRGSLAELLTTRDGPIEPIVHVYQVTAAPRSVRAWVIHRWQEDRLAFTNGRFQVVLYDIRPESPTRNAVNYLTLGHERPALLQIPRLVVHGIMNIGDDTAHFVNLPTTTYYRGNPDKFRIPLDDPRIPFSFDD